MMDGTNTGVVDRIVEDETAVILLEGDEEVLNQVEVAVDRLPNEGGHEGAVLEVEMQDGAFVDATYLAGRTEERQDAMQERLDELSRPLSEEESSGNQ